MNILIVSRKLLPEFTGGVETYIFNISKQLKRLGHKVYFITSDWGKQSKFSKVNNKDESNIYKYRGLPEKSKFKLLNPIINIINSYCIAKKISKQLNIDVLYLHFPYEGLGSLLAFKYEKCLKVYHFHSPTHREWQLELPTYSRYERLLRIMFIPVVKYIERIAVQKSEKIIVHSNYMKSQLVNIHKISQQKVKIIPGGVDTIRFSPGLPRKISRKKLGLSEKNVIILSVSRLARRKGLEQLIEAIDYVVKKNKEDISLLIGGKGEIEEKLKNLIAKKKLEKFVNLIGFIPDEKLPYYYRASNIFVMASTSLEGFGLATLEALSSGIPVIGSKSGGTIEILAKLDKELLFEPGNSRSLANRISNLLNNPSHMKSLEEKGSQLCIHNYSWDLIGTKVQDFFINNNR